MTEKIKRRYVKLPYIRPEYRYIYDKKAKHISNTEIRHYFFQLITYSLEDLVILQRLYNDRKIELLNERRRNRTNKPSIQTIRELGRLADIINDIIEQKQINVLLIRGCDYSP